MKRDDLMRRMHRAGLRLDDAATAAAVAMQAARRERDALIVRMLAPAPTGAGMSLRAVGSVFGLSYEGVRKVSTRARIELTPATATVQTPKQGMNP